MNNRYIPNINDIPETGYQPTLQDIPEEKTAAQNLMQQSYEMSAKDIPEKRQIQEQYSNPTQWPGFENLSKKEQLQRIALSQFDPANQTATGTFVPPGAYEHPATRMAASILPTLAAPQLRSGNMLLKGAANALSRIGAGTAGNVAYQSPNIENLEDLKNVAIPSAKMNALLEAGLLPYRAATGTAEMINPINYARSKAAKIKAEHDIAFNKMEENFKPINEKYGDFNVSVTPEKYLNKAGIKRNNLFENAQEQYDNFINEPTYKNLLNLKSQVGRDWASLKPGTDVNKLQQFSKYNRNLDQKAKSFLSRDENALNQYNLANQYASEVYYPYLSTPTLRKISKGKFNAIYPEKMAKSLEKAGERVVGQENRLTIPEKHPLRKHTKDLRNRITLGDISEMAIPSIAGLLGGGHFNPLGGTIGFGGGLGAGLASKLFRNKFLEYPIVQSQAVQNAFKNIEPLYYGGGRAGIAKKNEGNY